MKLIAGLGNPGREYTRTPHNVGYDVIDELRANSGSEWHTSRRFNARIARMQLAQNEVLLAQPLTFMNLSGESLAPLLRYHGGTVEDLVVVLDDADLPLGRLRIRPEGSSGGHRGLTSVIAALGTGAFVRVRLGVGRAGNRDLVGHVLGKFDSESWERARRMIVTATEAVECLLANGVAEAMNRYNGRGDEEITAPVSEQKGL